MMIELTGVDDLTNDDEVIVTIYRGLDKVPGDVRGSGTGEWRGQRNGLKAFFVRDDYMGGTL